MKTFGSFLLYFGNDAMINIFLTSLFMVSGVSVEREPKQAFNWALTNDSSKTTVR